MIDKLDDELLLEEHFAMVPEWLLRAALSDRAKTLYAVLHRFGNGTGRRMPGRAELATWLNGCSTDSIDRAIKELETFGAVQVTRRRNPANPAQRLTNVYRLRTSNPASSTPSRTRAATPGRTPAATLAAPVRHDRKRVLAPSGLRTPLQPDSGRTAASREEEDFGIDMGELAAQCRVARRQLELPAGRFVAKTVRRAIAAAVTGGHTPTEAVAALLVLANDPTTESPGRLPHDGPWWDVEHIAAAAERRASDAATCPCGGAGIYEVDGDPVRCSRHRPSRSA